MEQLHLKLLSYLHLYFITLKKVLTTKVSRIYFKTSEITKQRISPIKEPLTSKNVVDVSSSGFNLHVQSETKLNKIALIKYQYQAIINFNLNKEKNKMRRN